MSRKRGASNAPMILGIIGGVLGLPGALCSSFCTGMVATSAVETGTSGGGAFGLLSLIFLIAPIVGMVAGILSKKFPKKAGVTMIISALASGVSIITGNLIGLVVIILFLIGEFLSLNQEIEVIEN